MIGDWGLGLRIGPNPQSPIPNPQLFISLYKHLLATKIYNIKLFNNNFLI